MPVLSRLSRVLYESSELHKSFKEITLELAGDPKDSTVLDSNRHTYEQPAQWSGKLTGSGLFDPVDDLPKQQQGAQDTHVTYFPEGIAIGKICYGGHAVQSSVAITSAAGELVALALAAELNEVHVLQGKTLSDSIAISSTTNYGSVDNAASSANGGLAVAHVLANEAPGAALVIKVQQSADNSIWVDLATLPTVAALAKKGVHVLVAGTVQRYLRAIVTYQSGSGSTRSVVTFTRG